MKWCLGLDLQPKSLGALHFVRWLHAHGRSPGGETIRAAFVLEPRRVNALAQHTDLLEIRSQSELALRHLATQSGAHEIMAPVEVRSGAAADDVLSELAIEHDVDALVIGRAAASGDLRLTRLGRVARRLLRRLPRPVVVVPPELRVDAIGSGPVLLATSLSADSDGAAVFARSLADATGRPLVVAHVTPSPDDDATYYVPPAAIARMEQESVSTARRDLEVWMGQHALTGCNAIVAVGRPVQRLADIAKAENCPVIVCGSRLLGLGPRMLTSSFGTHMAAVAECATAVVPPLAAS